MQPLDAIAGQTIDAHDMFGISSRRVTEQLLAAKRADDRIRIMESLLLQSARDADVVNPLARAAVTALTTSNGCVSVRQLTAQLHARERHLNRTMHAEVGLGGKCYARIMRLQFVLAAFRSNLAGSMAGIDADAVYFDRPTSSRTPRLSVVPPRARSLRKGMR